MRAHDEIVSCTCPDVKLMRAHYVWARARAPGAGMGAGHETRQESACMHVHLITRND